MRRGNVCCVAFWPLCQKIVGIWRMFFLPWSVAAVVKNKYVVCVCVGDVMGVVFSGCIVRRGAVGARVWGV